MISFTLVPLNLPLRSPFVTFRGERDVTVDTVYINGSSEGVSFPTSTTWEYDAHLSPGTNAFEFQAEDVAANRSGVLRTEVVLQDAAAENHNIFNALDDLGLEVMIERLPGEKNYYLKNRILDAETNLGNTTYRGLVRGLSRELSLQIAEDVLTITPTEDTTARTLRAHNAYITIEPTRLLLEADELRVEGERLRLDPGSGEVGLAQIPLSKEDLRLQTRDGKVLESWEYELADEQTLRGLSGHRLLLASYNYKHPIQLAADTTLAQLETAIEAITGLATTTLFQVTVAAGYATALAKNLVREIRLLIDREGLSLDLCYAQPTPLGDEDFRVSLRNEYDTFLGTRLESYARMSNARSRILLQDTLLDRDNVLDPDPNEDLAVLDHIFDPVLSYYRCADPTDSGRYSRREFEVGSGYCPNHPTKELKLVGIRPEQVQAGVADDVEMVAVV
jgi:hypothetical protein